MMAIFGNKTFKEVVKVKWGGKSEDYGFLIHSCWDSYKKRECVHTKETLGMWTQMKGHVRAE